jgi:hypothetical protein
MFQINFVEKIKTHNLSSITFSENRVVCKIMLKNVVEPQAAENMAPVRGILDK